MISSLPFISKERSFGSVFFWAKVAAGLGLALLGVAWLVPNHYRPWPSFHSEMIAFAGMSLLAVASLLGQKTPLRAPWFVAWVIGCLVVVWLQWMAGISVYAGDAWTASFYLLAFSAAVVLGYSHAAGAAPSATQQTALLAPFMAVLAVGAVVSALIGLSQWLEVEEALGIFVVNLGIGERAAGNLAQPNHLATVLLLGMLGLLYLFEKRRLSGSIVLLAIGVLSFALLLTQSRAGLLGALATAGFLLLKRRHWSARWPARWILYWLGAVAAGVWLLPELAKTLLIGGDRGISLTDGSGRWQMWRQMAHGIGESPWWGYGWNQTVKAQMAGAIAYPSNISTDYAHNLLLDLLAWNGIPLGLVLIAAGAYWVVSRCIRTRGTDAVYALALLLPFGVHGMVEYPFAYAYFLLPVGLMVGVIEASVVRSHVHAVSLHLRQSFVAVGLACWLALTGYFVCEYFLIEEDFRVTRFESMRIGKTPAEYEVPQVHMVSHMGAMLRATRMQAKPGMDPAELEALREVAERFGYGVITYRYALALGLNGRTEESSRWFAVLRGMYGPNYYAVVRAETLQSANGRWPQLKAVQLPR